ncbi:MAG: DUF58 domain-containing protein [Acetobacteraceae bacterium]
MHGRRRVGQGDSFWKFRRFVAGDPVTRVDWRQSAKSGRPMPEGWFIRETEWERRRPSACGATSPPLCAGARGLQRWRSATVPDCCSWHWPRCCCAAASGW